MNDTPAFIGRTSQEIHDECLREAERLRLKAEATCFEDVRRELLGLAGRYQALARATLRPILPVDLG